MSTTASVDPPRSVLEAGREGTSTITLRNDSDIVEEYSFQVVGGPAAWTRVDPPEVTVYPGQSTTAVVKFTPPRSSAVPAGENPYGIHVQPAKRSENATVPEGVLEILPFYETVAELSPQTAKGKGAEQYRISVANRGNAPMAVALAGKSASDELDLTLEQERQTIDPGTTWISQLRGHPTERLWHGTPTAYPFTVMVRPEQGPEIPLAGTQYQQPILPAWLPKVLLALPVLAVLGVVLYILLRPPDTVAVPPLVGEEVSAAEAELRERELEPRRLDRSDDEVPINHIVSTDPPASTQLKKSETVTLRVSTGPGTVPVPAVTGQEVPAAEKALEAVGLVPQRTDVSNEDVPLGYVVSTDPQAGTKLKEGEAVDLKVSKGPPTDGATPSDDSPAPPDVEIPGDLVGRTEADVRQALESVGLAVGSTRTADSSTVLQGHVIAIDPKGGTTVKKGTEVQMVVSTGLVTVPQLEGQSFEEATAALGRDEVQLPYEVKSTARAGIEPGQVVDQSPDADQSVPQGSTIILTVTEASTPTLPEDNITLAAPADSVPQYVYWPEEQTTHPFTVTRMDIAIAEGDAGFLTVERVDWAETPVEILINQAPLTDMGRGGSLIATEGAGFVSIQPFHVGAGERLKMTLVCNSAGGGGDCVESFSIDGEFD